MYHVYIHVFIGIIMYAYMCNVPNCCNHFGTMKFDFFFFSKKKSKKTIHASSTKRSYQIFSIPY